MLHWAKQRGDLHATTYDSHLLCHWYWLTCEKRNSFQKFFAFQVLLAALSDPSGLVIGLGCPCQLHNVSKIVKVILSIQFDLLIAGTRGVQA